MSIDRETDLGNNAEFAIQRALEAAGLRAGDTAGGSSVAMVGDREFGAAEAGDATPGNDAD
jgi:hypothetical protein